MVDALKYMVRNGGTIVMHGITHQYKGVTGADFEFWDENTNSPIKEETIEGISKKIELGIQEFMKNGLYPLVWETPHYTASMKLYETIPKYFSTAMEQRLVIENFDYSQFFPYVINKDLYGQKIFPENLGFVPLDENIEVSRDAVKKIIEGAKVNLNVRDGFASCFFHEFLDISLLKELVEGIKSLGYEYLNVRDMNNWVKTKDRVIISGTCEYNINLDDQYLLEAHFDYNGELIDKKFSDKRIKGNISKLIKLKPGELYKAEPIEYYQRELTFWEKTINRVKDFYNKIVKPEENWKDIRAVILWNHYARGAGYNDQASFVSAFRSINVNVDTIFIGQKIKLEKYNLLIVPYAFVDSLSAVDYDVIVKFLEGGGNLITDTKNELAEELGIKFTKTQVRVSKVRDNFFPEEDISWRYFELINKFESAEDDEVFCRDEVSEIPLVIGRKFGKGKLIFITTRFDPYSQSGYSHFPFLMEYVRKYFQLRPIILRQNLEVFFDPGFRHTYSIENLIKQWVN
ncbi:MAG: DUF2334 domain-containing protein, partial [Ignavibacteria bacterium]|nr:DUF2334 domain-containing protein [Ignavibacteria bacterium]